MVMSATLIKQYLYFVTVCHSLVFHFLVFHSSLSISIYIYIVQCIVNRFCMHRNYDYLHIEVLYYYGKGKAWE